VIESSNVPSRMKNAWIDDDSFSLVAFYGTKIHVQYIDIQYTEHRSSNLEAGYL
jgi:hypothetical protein